MGNGDIILKRRTPIYVSYGKITISDEIGIEPGGYWPYCNNPDIRSPLMDEIEDFFRKEYDRLYPKSLKQKFWIAKLNLSGEIPVENSLPKTFEADISVGVVCQEILEPYNILEWDEVIDRKRYVNGRLYYAYLDTPFLVKGHSNFLGINKIILPYLSNNIIEANKDDGTYFWDLMKRKALCI